MKGYVKLTPEGLIALNSDNTKDQTMYNNDETTREFTTEEYTLFGDQLKYAGNENTKVTGTSLDDAKVSFTPYTATELFNTAISVLRYKRNKLLKETDYAALQDVTMSNDMKEYRQTLRDLTNDLTTEAEVNAVTYPTKPSS
tara:strand:- start:426 stop:851 length:426 start_codon:yes stop_codon:yes gene_type:complete